MGANSTYALQPISVEQADHLRRCGGEVFVADSMPGYPCRQCLKDAEVGEELILVSCDPFEKQSPYRSASPIFLHLSDCGVFEKGEDLPLQLTRRQLSIRAFDSGEMMVDAAVIEGDELDGEILRLFDNDAVERLHIHNASRGCWAVTVVRKQ